LVSIQVPSGVWKLSMMIGLTVRPQHLIARPIRKVRTSGFEVGTAALLRPNGARKRDGRTMHLTTERGQEAFGWNDHALQRNAAHRTGRPGRREGHRSNKRRGDASASDLRRPPVAGTAETLRMIAPGPDDRPGKPWWTFGSNRVERTRCQGGFRASRAEQPAMGETLSGGSTGTAAKGGTSRDDPNGAKSDIAEAFGFRR
jgi:hypothetical protein